MLTRRSIFDRVKTHLLTQNAKAVSHNTCCYRTKNGLKCAIGCLIPDDLYHKSMEGPNIKALLDKRSVLNVFGESLDSNVTWEFLQTLQNIHDIYNPEDWPKELADLEHYV